MLPLLVLSLARAAERRVKVSKHLREQGYSFALLPGVDYIELTDKDLKGVDWDRSKRELAGRPGQQWMTLPEIATFMSHRKAWQFIAESGMKRCMVVEDDVRMLYAADEAERTMMQFFYEQPDFKFLQCNYPFTDMQLKEGHNGYNEMTNAPMGSYCYVMSGDYAKKALAMSHDLSVPVDVFIRRESNRTSGLFLLGTWLAEHDGEGRSYIRDLPEDEKNENVSLV